MLTFESKIVRNHIQDISSYFEKKAKGQKSTLKINNVMILECDGTQEIDFNNEDKSFQEFDYEALTLAFSELTEVFKKEFGSYYSEVLQIEEMVSIKEEYTEEEFENLEEAVLERYSIIMQDNIHWYRDGVDDAGRKYYDYDWNSEKLRKMAYDALVKMLGKTSANKIQDDFIGNSFVEFCDGDDSCDYDREY